MINTKIKKILVPMDGSKNSFRGLDEAIIIARHCHATLTGLFVTPIPPPEKDEQISSIERKFLQNTAKFMAKAKKYAAQNGILFDDKVLYGDEGKQIISFSKKGKFDLIIIGSRGMSSTKQLFLGSTSNHVLHKSQIPVLIVK